MCFPNRQNLARAYSIGYNGGMPALMPNADRRYVIGGQWFLLLTLLSYLGCSSKSSADYDKERFEKAVSEVRAGKQGNLYFYDTHNTDGLLQSITGLSGIKCVSFAHTDVTPAGFAAVAQLPDLHEVDFYETRTHDDRWLDVLVSSQALEIVSVDDYFSPPFFSVSKILALPHLRKLVMCVYVLEINGRVAEGPQVD